MTKEICWICERFGGKQKAIKKDVLCHTHLKNLNDCLNKKLEEPINKSIESTLKPYRKVDKLN